MIVSLYPNLFGLKFKLLRMASMLFVITYTSSQALYSNFTWRHHAFHSSVPLHLCLNQPFFFRGPSLLCSPGFRKAQLNHKFLGYLDEFLAPTLITVIITVLWLQISKSLSGACNLLEHKNHIFLNSEPSVW